MKNINFNIENIGKYYLFKLILILNIFVLLYVNALRSEPLVILEYYSDKYNGQENENALGNNSFTENYDYSSHHVVKKDETLSNIIYNYYGKAGLNKRVLELAIVTSNSSAFVRNNPHFMYAGKKLYLPSINEIRNLILRNPNKVRKNDTIYSPQKEIYFFGG